MSPENLENKVKNRDPFKQDVWSLACILFELLYKKLPWY